MGQEEELLQCERRSVTGKKVGLTRFNFEIVLTACRLVDIDDPEVFIIFRVGVRGPFVFCERNWFFNCVRPFKSLKMHLTRYLPVKRFSNTLSFQPE